MPTYGYFTMDEVEPARTWKADYIVSKGVLIQFWNRCSAGEKSDTLVGSARLEKGTICDVALTSRTEPKVEDGRFDYRSLIKVDQQETVPILG
jgi:hypothetical protein